MAFGTPKNEKELAPLTPWLYDLVLWSFSIVVDIFFREIAPRGSWRIPTSGPVLFVAAPHANQFVDPLILMRVLRLEVHRRVAILIAEKSMRRKFVGMCSRAAGAIPVARALDSTKAGSGKIYLPDPANQPTLLRGMDTKFEKEAQVGGLVVLPYVNGNAANAEVQDIISNTELRLKRRFAGPDATKQLTGLEGVGNGDTKVADDFPGCSYKTAPKVDQTKVYDAVFDRLDHGGCICIFPEGGSHDRTELLPLKPGVAIMALGALAANPDSGLKIVPCGMNYFHAHKFRSRAVVEFGTPLEVPKELVKMYSAGERREATRQLLEIIYQALLAVTVTTPDYDTLMLISAARRLYKPKGRKLPLGKIVELNRRLVQGYAHFKSDPRLIKLKKSVTAYNKQLALLGLRDHQVEYARFSIVKVVSTLIYRVLTLAVLSIGTIPGTILFSPVFIAAKIISTRKSREALAASTVKLEGKDVIATWKVLVAMAFAPTLYTLYTFLLTYWTYRSRIRGLVPEWVPLWMVVLLGYIFFPMITYASFRIGETGMDIVKSLRPLVLSLNPTSANTLVKLRGWRERLRHEVTDLINDLGPELYPDFDQARLISDPSTPAPESALSPVLPTSGAPATTQPRTARTPASSNGLFPLSPRRHTFDSVPTLSSAHGQLPRNESFGDLGKMGLFASRPGSRSHSRAASRTEEGRLSGGAAALPSSDAAMASKESLEEVSRRIRGAMGERARQRVRRTSDEGWEFEDGVEEEDEEEEKKKV